MLSTIDEFEKALRDLPAQETGGDREEKKSREDES